MPKVHANTGAAATQAEAGDECANNEMAHSSEEGSDSDGRVGRKTAQKPKARDKATTKEEARARAEREIVGDDDLLNEVYGQIDRFFGSVPAKGMATALKKPTTYADNGLVRSVKTKVDAAHDAFWKNRPYHAKLPSHASVMAIRFCHDRNGLDEVVGGKLASMGCMDLCGISRTGSVRSGGGNAGSNAGPSHDELEARFIFQGSIMAKQVEQLNKVEAKLDKVDEVVTEIGQVVTGLVNNAKATKAGIATAVQASSDVRGLKESSENGKKTIDDANKKIALLESGLNMMIVARELRATAKRLREEGPAETAEPAARRPRGPGRLASRGSTPTPRPSRS